MSNNKSMFSIHERIAILGASRGLGAALTLRVLEDSKASLGIASRSILKSSFLETSKPWSHRLSSKSIDFTKPEAIDQTLQFLNEFQPTRIFYCAGGGPFGLFHKKPWHSHAWTFQLNFIFPVQLLHSLLSTKIELFGPLQQMIFVGSAIAEAAADPGAASYSGAKHGLRGILQSVVSESTTPALDLRLYSPGYMDTGLLPQNSWPRRAGSKIADPMKIAHDFLHWSLIPPTQTQWHHSTNPFDL